MCIVGSGTDGVSTPDIRGSVGNDRETGRAGTAEPVRSKSLVAEDRAEGVARQLGGRAVGKELENERNLREGGENTSDVELELET